MSRGSATASPTFSLALPLGQACWQRAPGEAPGPHQRRACCLFRGKGGQEPEKELEWGARHAHLTAEGPALLGLRPPLPHPPALQPSPRRVSVPAPWAGTCQPEAGVLGLRVQPEGTSSALIASGSGRGQAEEDSGPAGMEAKEALPLPPPQSLGQLPSERPLPPRPGEPRGGFSVGTWTWGLELGIYFLYYHVLCYCSFGVALL